MTHRFEGSCNTNILKWKLYRKINSIRTSHQTFVLMKTSWRRLEDVFRLRLQRTSWRRLDQDEHIRLSHTLSEDIFKKSSRRLGQDQCIRLGHTSSRRLQDIFKTSCQTSSIRLQEVLQKCLQDIFKTSSRRFEDVLKTSCKDLFKTFLKRIIKLNCSCWHVFKMTLRHIQNFSEMHCKDGYL